MKRNFLKTSLAAFAFTMAIVASFAFSPALNDAADDPVNGYVQVIQPQSCEKVIHDCEITGDIDCTIPLEGGQAAVFRFRNPSNTICSTPLRRPQQ